jgi:hypothetical protein
MEHLPRYEFQKCVSRYGGDLQRKSFSCWDQFLAMGFAQFTYRESLRDIEACLRSVSGKLYHMGFRGRVSRSTLADANESRDWRIFADFAQVLIAMARPMYAGDPIGVDPDGSLYALDSTTIDLCLSLFPWARFRQHKAAIKLHTLLDLLTTNAAERATLSPDKVGRSSAPVAKIFQRLQALRTAECMTSTCSMRSSRSPARSTSWIAATSISSVCSCSLSAQHSSLCERRRTSCCRGVTPVKRTRAPECAPITPSF